MTLRYQLEPGIRINSLPATTSTADTKGTPISVPFRPGGMNEERIVVWEVTVVGSPSALVMELQGAETDTEAEYTILDTYDGTTSYMRTVGPIIARFLRIRQTSRTGGTSVQGDLTVG